MEDYLDQEVLILPEEDAKGRIKKSLKINIWEIYKKLERKKSLLEKVQKALETISNDLLNNKQTNDMFELADSSETKYDFTKLDANIDNLHEEYRKSEYNTKCLRDKLSEEISCLEDKLKKEIEKGIKTKKSEELLKYRNGILKDENSALQRSLEELKMILNNIDEEKYLENDGEKAESISKIYADMTTNALDIKKSSFMPSMSHFEKLENKTKSPYIGPIRKEEIPIENQVRNIGVNGTNSYTVNSMHENRSKPVHSYERQCGITKECVMYNTDADDMEQLLSMFETFRTTSNSCCFCPVSCASLKPGNVYSHAVDSSFTNSALPFMNASKSARKSQHRYQQHQIQNRNVQEEKRQEEKRRAFSFGASFLIAIGIFVSLYYRYTTY